MAAPKALTSDVSSGSYVSRTSLRANDQRSPGATAVAARTHHMSTSFSAAVSGEVTAMLKH